MSDFVAVYIVPNVLLLCYTYFVQNYYKYYGTGQEPLISLGFFTMLSCMVAIGLAIGVTIAVGGLLIIQVYIFNDA